MQHLVDTKKKLIEAVSHLANEPRLAHDTETFNRCGLPDVGGLNPHHGSRAFAHILATKEDEFYFNFNIGGINHKHMPLMQPVFDDPKKLIFYINAIFDLSIMHMDGLVNHCRVADGQALARVEFNRHLDSGRSDDESYLSFDYLYQYYLEKRKDDGVVKYITENDLYLKDKNGDYILDRFKTKKIPLYHLVPLEIMFAYGCTDGRGTFDTCTKIIQDINYKDERFEHQKYSGFGKMIEVAKNEIELTTVLADMKIEGFKVWTPYVQKAIKHETALEKKLTAEVRRDAGEINLNSPKQVANFLISKKIPVPRKTITANAIKQRRSWESKKTEYLKKLSLLNDLKDSKKIGTLNKRLRECDLKIKDYSVGNYCVDANTIEKLAEKHKLPFLLNITAAKQCGRKIGTYYNNFIKLKDDDDIIHANLNQATTITGRLSSSVPNLQNLHKEPITCLHCKKALEDPNQDCKKHALMQFDPDDFLIRKSFIVDDPDELLLFADYKQQEMIVMLDQAGEMTVINRLLSGEFEDFYLATAAVIFDKSGIKITRKQAKAIALGLAYGEGIMLLAKGLGCSVAEAKTIKEAFFRALPKLKELDKRLKNEAGRTGKIHNPFGRVTYLRKDKDYTALNSFVQGTSADITKTAMVRVYKRMKKEGLKSKLLLSVHDELIFKVKKYELEKMKKLISEEMSASYPHKYIALGVDFEVARPNKYKVCSWGEKLPEAA